MELREVLGAEAVSLVIRKDRLNRFGHVLDDVKHLEQ